LRPRRNWEDKLGIADSEDKNIPSTMPEDDDRPSENLEDDYRFVKRELRKSMKTNQEVVDILLEELRADPSPRMAEVVARLLEAVASSGSQILQASKTVAEIYKLAKEEVPKDAKPTQVIEKAIFFGKMSDVLKFQSIQDEQKMLEAVGVPEPLEEQDEDPYG
jgi:hypothetical protein